MSYSENKEKGTVDMAIYQEDRFFIKNCGILWMYHNPDALCGDQFVTNSFGDVELQSAIEDCMDAGLTDPAEVFELLGERCRQYCSDSLDCPNGTWPESFGDKDLARELYECDERQFFSEPFAVGMTQETLDKIRTYYKKEKEVA